MTSRYHGSRVEMRLLWIVALSVTNGLPAHGQSEQALPEQATVFAPGTISVEGSNIYRGSFAADGREFYFFRNVTEGEEEYRIFVSRLGPSGWIEPERVDLGGEFSDLYPAISPDGRRLVFSSYRPIPAADGTKPNANLWIAERTDDGAWRSASLLAQASTPANYDAGPAFYPDGSIRFVTTTPDWSTTTHVMTRLADGAYGPAEVDDRTAPWEKWREDAHVWDVVFDDDRNVAILDVSEIDADGRRGPSDLWVSLREGSDWSTPRRLGAGVNTRDAYENFVVLHDGGLYFVRDFERYWRVSLSAAIEDARE